MSSERNSAKQKFIDTAHRLFAERGYYGVSLADVSDELGLTKQAVLYHFRTKETLYGQVFKGVAERLEAIMDEVDGYPGSSSGKLRTYLEKLHDHMQVFPLDARLIARELLDNLDRARTSRKWYLRRFLDDSVALVANTPAWQSSTIDEHTAAAVQLLGAISYFATAEATFEAIWGADRLEGARHAYLPTLCRLAMAEADG